MTHTMNIQRLNHDRRALEARIRLLKADLRTRWTQPMVAQQRELLGCKREATQLCVLRAYHRGRWHLSDHERCLDIVSRRAAEYSLEPCTEVA